jgi:arylsulfatase A-like enzyme
MLHLADAYDALGLFIDFGTASRVKYTDGNWPDGWVDDRREGESSVSTFSSKGRVYLPFASAEQSQLRIRFKAYASGPLIVRLNGKQLAATQVSADKGFEESVVQIPDDSAHVGENEIELNATGTALVDGKTLSVAIDWMRLEPSPIDHAVTTSSLRPRPVEVEQISAEGVQRAAVRLAPGAQLDWFVEVPNRAVLQFGAASLPGGAGVLMVDVKSDRRHTGKRVGVAQRWHEHELALDELTGEVARLRFRNDGSKEVALSGLRVERSSDTALASEARARNVVVLLIDTLRASKLQLYNPDSRVKTPVLDRFAAQGVLFERPQAPANWTKPSVASVLTSLYPSSHHTQAQAAKLSDSVTMLSEAYKGAGFRTASFITNSFVSPAFGFDQGWDLNVNMDYLADSNDGNAENVFKAASDWIEKNQNERFFLYIQTIDPHVPYDPPPKYIEMYDPQPYDGQVKNKETPALLVEANTNPTKLTERDKVRVEALHDGEITYHDTELAHFLTKMRDLGLDESTVVVITSDHGEEFEEHGKWGHGHSVYQELLHVPLVFRWPGVIPSGVRIAPVVSIIDIGPTVLEAAGVPIPSEFQGRSLMGFIRGDWPRAPHVAFSEWENLEKVIRGGEWKLVLNYFRPHVLYDLRDDPWEQKQLDGTQHPIAQRYLRTLMGQFLGALDRRHWLAPAQATPALADKSEPREEMQEMTPELCRQLVALGYVIAQCD